MTSWWRSNQSFPNHPYCNVCEMSRRGWIANRAGDDPSALVPPIAICPICDWAEGEHGPPIDLQRVRDVPRE